MCYDNGVFINTFDVYILKAFGDDALSLCKPTKQFESTVLLYEYYCSVHKGADK